MRGPVRRAVARLHFFLACLVGGLTFVGLSLGGLVYVALHPRGSSPVYLSRTLHWIMRAVLGWRVTVEDRGHVAESVPAILMVAHKSNLDIVVYGGLYPKRAVVIGKKEVAKIPVFGWFFRATGNILLDRKDLPSAIEEVLFIGASRSCLPWYCGGAAPGPPGCIRIR